MQNKKALIRAFGPPDVIEVVSDHAEEPKPGQVRVRIEASTVSSTDVFIRKGIYPLLKQKPPLVLGYDFVGIVEKLGAGVETVNMGDRIAAITMTGGNAQFICIDAEELTVVSSQVNAIEAACLTLSGLTAYQMFFHFAQVKHGQRILVHGGSGAIGDTLLQLGLMMQCDMVSTASLMKHDIIEGYGALAIDYRDPNYRSLLRESAGDGFDAVFDFTNHASFNHDIHLLKKGGVLVTYAVYTSSLNIKKKNFFNFAYFVMDFVWMMVKLKWWNTFSGKRAFFYGSGDSKQLNRGRYDNDLATLYRWVEEGKIHPLVSKVYGLSGVGKAHEMLQDGFVQGQIVILNEHE